MGSGVSGPSILIESTDSMIYNAREQCTQYNLLVCLFLLWFMLYGIQDNPMCTMSSYINQFREYAFHLCVVKNQYIGAVESYHVNSKEDWR